MLDSRSHVTITKLIHSKFYILQMWPRRWPLHKMMPLMLLRNVNSCCCTPDLHNYTVEFYPTKRISLSTLYCTEDKTLTRQPVTWWGLYNSLITQQDVYLERPQQNKHKSLSVHLKGWNMGWFNMSFQREINGILEKLKKESNEHWTSVINLLIKAWIIKNRNQRNKTMLFSAIMLIDLECEKTMLDSLFRRKFWFCIHAPGKSHYVGNIWSAEMWVTRFLVSPVRPNSKILNQPPKTEIPPLCRDQCISLL